MIPPGRAHSAAWRHLVPLMGLLALAVAGSADASRTLLLLSVAGTDDDRAFEQRLALELELAVDGIVLRSAPAGLATFADESLARQMEILEPLMADEVVLAAVWLDRGEPASPRLNLLFVNQGRAVLRMVEVDGGEGAEARLALAAREVLATALIPESPPPPPITTEEPVADEPVPIAPPVAMWAVGLHGGITGSFSGRTGPDPRAGALVRLERRLAGRLWIGLGGVFRVGMRALFSGEPNELIAGGHLGLSWLPGGDVVGGGPTLAVEVVRHRVVVPGPVAAAFTQLRISPGAAARLRLSAGADLVLHVGITWLPARDVVKRSSDTEVVLDTGQLDGFALLGVRFSP